MRDRHQLVVDHHRVVVGGDAVGAHEHRVADLVGVEGHRAAHQILEHDVPARRHPQADDGVARPRPGGSHFLRVEAATGAGVPRGLPRRQLRLALGLQLLGRAEAAVGVPRPKERCGVRAVEIEALRLAIRSQRAAHLDALVPVETHPAEVLQDFRLRLPGGPFEVGVLDAEQEDAALAPGEQPVEQRRSSVADVQMAGGRRGEADSHDH